MNVEVSLPTVPTGLISRRPTAIVSRFLSADSRGFRILDMFDRGSQLTFTELVVESADSWIGSADSTADSTENPLKSASGYGRMSHIAPLLESHLT